MLLSDGTLSDYFRGMFVCSDHLFWWLRVSVWEEKIKEEKVVFVIKSYKRILPIWWKNFIGLFYYSKLAVYFTPHSVSVLDWMLYQVVPTHHAAIVFLATRIHSKTFQTDTLCEERIILIGSISRMNSIMEKWILGSWDI